MQTKELKNNSLVHVEEVEGVEHALEGGVLVLNEREEDVASGRLREGLVALALELQLHARLPPLLHLDRQNLAVHVPEDCAT